MDVITRYIETTWENRTELVAHSPFVKAWERDYVKCFCTLSNLHQFDWERFIRERQSHNEFEMNDENAAYYVWSETRKNGYIKNTNNEFQGFDWKSYLNHNCDLGKLGEQEAYFHWINYGRNENRIVDARMCLKSGIAYSSFLIKLLGAYLYYDQEPVPEFDWERYIQDNRDLKNAGINSESKAYSHWIQYGCKEGRKAYIVNTNVQYTIFDWKSFVEHNHELTENRVSNPIWAYGYWCKWSRRTNTPSRIKIKKDFNIFVNEDHNKSLYDLIQKELELSNDDGIDEFIKQFIDKYLERQPICIENGTKEKENAIFCYGEIENQAKVLRIIKEFRRVCYFDKSHLLKICFGKIYQYPDFIDNVKSLLVGLEENIQLYYNLTQCEIESVLYTCSQYVLCSNKFVFLNLCSEYIEEMSARTNFRDLYTSNLPLYNKIVVFVPYCEVYRAFIIECLNSIEGQYYTNYEVVILNDGASDIRFIRDFMENKSNYSIIEWDKNLGPGYSKYKIIEHVQQSNYGKNDIMLFIDGDDYLSTFHAFTIVNSYYVKTKCWATCGNYEGRWSEHTKNAITYIENENRRNSDTFIFPPLRTCKMGLLHYIDKELFRVKNVFISKCTDVMLFVNILELCSPMQIQYIAEKLYVYREHTNNTYKTVVPKVKEDIMMHIKKGPHMNKKMDSIHLLMATYNRNDNLDKVFHMICAQTVAKNITLHIIDNNTDKLHNDYVTALINKYQDKLNIKLYSFGYNYHCYSKVIVARQIRHEHVLDYLIIFDDDQIYPPTWCENLIKNAHSLSVTSWYGKQFASDNYFDSKIEFREIEKKARYNEINTYKYFGSGGCIIDASLFLYNELYKFDNYDSAIIKIDDLWMSFIFDKYLNIPFYRTLETPREFIGRFDTVNATWANTKQDKVDLMKKFIQNYGWRYDTKMDRFITLNNYFDKIYVLNLKSHKTKRTKMRDQLNDLNISATFIEAHNGKDCVDCTKYINDFMKWDINHPNVHPIQKQLWNNVEKRFTGHLLRTSGTVGIIRSMETIFKDAIKHEYNRILVFQDDVLFDKHFATKFDNHIRKIPIDWEILNLGTTKWNSQFTLEKGGYYIANSTTYGSFAQGFSKDVMSKIVQRLEKPNISFDSLLSTEFSKKYYCMYPSLCIADLSESDSGKNVRDLIETVGVYNSNNLHWNLETKNYLPYWNINVNIYYTGEKPNCPFHYYNYKIDHIDNFNKETTKECYVLILNNANSRCYYDIDLIGRMLEKMKREQLTIMHSESFEVEAFDCKHYEMMCKYSRAHIDNLPKNDKVQHATLYKNSIYIENVRMNANDIQSSKCFVTIM